MTIAPMRCSIANRKSQIANGSWLPDMDLNHDKQIQSLLCYRYTIGQTSEPSIRVRRGESRVPKLNTVRASERQSVRAFFVSENATTLPRYHAPTN
jgi:hypothetical protein